MPTAGKDYQMSKPLQTLAKHRAVITPISGMYHPHGLGHHHNCSTIWLTGGKIGQSERNTISVDQLIATVTGPQTRFTSLEISNQGHSLSYKDADGPLLETTMALYGSGMAYGHSHGNASLPLVLAGGTALGFKHGRHVDFNLSKDFQGYDKHPGIYHSAVNSKAHLSNLLLTMAQMMDVPVEKFADSNGIVSEVT